jgi:hypothetical protein
MVFVKFWNRNKFKSKYYLLRILCAIFSCSFLHKKKKISFTNCSKRMCTCSQFKITSFRLWVNGLLKPRKSVKLDHRHSNFFFVNISIQFSTLKLINKCTTDWKFAIAQVRNKLRIGSTRNFLKMTRLCVKFTRMSADF